MSIRHTIANSEQTTDNKICSLGTDQHQDRHIYYILYVLQYTQISIADRHDKCKSWTEKLIRDSICKHCKTQTQSHLFA